MYYYRVNRVFKNTTLASKIHALIFFLLSDCTLFNFRPRLFQKPRFNDNHGNKIEE